MHITTSPPNDALPAYANSISGLEYIGFTPLAARRIYTNWATRPRDNPDSLWDYITGHSNMIYIPSLISKTPRQRMTAIGLVPEIQDAILDGRFEAVFRAKDLGFWIRETLEVNYAGLCVLVPEDEVEEREDADRAALRAAARAEMGKEGEAAVSAIEPKPTLSLTSSQTADSLPPALFQRCVLRPGPPPVLDGLTVLYKACAVPTPLEGCPHVLDEVAGVTFSALADWDCIGDFHSGRRASYWVPDKAVAELYRRYIAARCRKAATCIVRVLVPDTWLASVRVQSLLGDEKRWKEYVLWCRRGRILPSEGFEGLDEADVVVGYICTMDERFSGTTFKDVQSATVAVDALRSEDGRKAVQWCFNKSCRDETLLERAVRGKVHFEVFEEEDRVERREREEIGRYTMEMSWA